MRKSSIEDEAHELSEKSSLDIESSAADDDQKRGLLDESTGSQKDGTGSQTRARNRKASIWWTVCLAATAICLAAALWTLIRKAKPEGDRTSRAEITSNHYVLDPKWNYAAPPQRREYKWTIQDHTHNPDGIYRPMILVNNQYPGPLIEANEGDTIVVHVQNQATNATAIHWHGIYQIGTPHMDGTVGVTQCPIASGRSFTYEFTVTGQSGTYWWHGHQGLQSSDGLHGPLVIHGREERMLQQIPYDTDRVVLLSDHYHDLSSALLWQYLMPDMENTEPVPESGLINGKNIRSCDDYPDRRCDNTTANVGRAKVVLERNKNHRLRFINVGAFAEFSVQLDEHELAVTEVDGTDVIPVKYHRLNISPAQRYSVIISSNVTSADTFWLRARMITNCFTDPPKTLQSDTFAVVRYADGEDGEDGEPKSNDWEEQLAQDCKDMSTTELVPVETQSASSEPDAVFYLRSNFEIGAYRLSRGFFNGSSWRAKADDPTLHRSIDGLNNDRANYTAPHLSSMPLADDRADTAFVNDRAFDINSELVIQTTGVQTIDIMISNFDDGAHPYHLHGYKFSVLAQGHGQPPLTSVGAEINRESLSPLYDTLDLTNPLRRDTASVEGYGWILLRVVADNPGQWAFHCHVSWHAEAGLLMQLLTDTDGLADIKIPQANQDLCAADGINMGMGPKDDDYIEFAK
jgi:FtsP/CotA-like multicopper oxidase with cupredoxin domain